MRNPVTGRAVELHGRSFGITWENASTPCNPHGTFQHRSGMLSSHLESHCVTDLSKANRKCWGLYGGGGVGSCCFCVLEGDLQTPSGPEA